MPTILKYLLSAEKTRTMKFPKLKWVLTGGMKPTADVIEKTKETFACEFIQGYGMTEATVHCSFKNESLEPTEDGLDLVILNEADEEVADGTVGEISIRGPTVFAGYDYNSSLNEEVFTASGYFRSGDLGYKNNKKQLYISGFVHLPFQDMIIVGGENVFAMEVEMVVSRLHGIYRVAVFGGPDDALGEVVHCAVMLTEAGPLNGMHDEDIEQMIHKLDPQNEELMKSFESLEMSHVQTKTQKHFATKEAAVVGAVASVLGRAITADDFDTPFMDLNMASMEFTRVINLLGGMLRGGELSPTLLFENDNLTDLIKHIESREDLVLVTSEEDSPKQSLKEIARIHDRRANGWSQFNPLTLIFLPLVWPVSVLLLMLVVVILKWLILGCCTPSTILMWSPQYHVWLCMYNLFQSIDPFLAMFRGTPILTFFYNRCGAHITYSSELHTSNLTDLDMIRIHGDCLIDRACNIQPSHIVSDKRGYVLLGKIKINKGCFVGYGATIEPHVTLEKGSFVRPLKSVSVAHSVHPLPEGRESPKPGRMMPWLAVLQAAVLYYLAGLFVVISVAAGVAIMYNVPSHRSHITLLLPLSLTQGVTGVTIPFVTADLETDYVWWTLLPLVVFLVIPHAYFLSVVLAKHLIVGYAQPGSERRSRNWKTWLYVVLIDCPLFRMATQFTVMSHLTKWQFKLLGCKIGDRAYFCAPFIRDPELVEIGDNCIVANTVVLHCGCDVLEESIVGDGVSMPPDKVLTECMVAVRDNSDTLPYIMMKRQSISQVSPATTCSYTYYQVLLILLQLVLVVGTHIPGLTVS
eukprot:g8670.t1